MASTQQHTKGQNMTANEIANRLQKISHGHVSIVSNTIVSRWGNTYYSAGDTVSVLHNTPRSLDEMVRFVKQRDSRQENEMHLTSSTDRDMYSRAKRDHKIACGGEFISFSEFMAEPYGERKAYAAWLRAEARDVRREARHG